MKGWVGLYRSSRLSEISACLYCHTRHSTRWWQLTERNRWLDPVDICVLLTHLPTLLYLNLPIADLQVYGVVLTGSAGSWLTGVLCCTVLYLQGVPVADLQVYCVVLSGSAGSWLTGVLCCTVLSGSWLAGVLCCTVLYLQGVLVADLQVYCVVLCCTYSECR